MPKYKKQFFKTIEFKKSVVVGIIVLILDIFQHLLFTSRPETFMYYFWKPIISGYVAWHLFEYQKKITNRVIFLYSLAFSALHGLYYRILDFVQGNPFWARVQDITIITTVSGRITLFSRDNIIISMIGWAFIHGGAFLISIFITNKLIKK